MPKSGYIQTKQHRKKISDAMQEVAVKWNKIHPSTDRWGKRGKLGNKKI